MNIICSTIYFLIYQIVSFFLGHFTSFLHFQCLRENVLYLLSHDFLLILRVIYIFNYSGKCSSWRTIKLLPFNCFWCWREITSFHNLIFLIKFLSYITTLIIVFFVLLPLPLFQNMCFWQSAFWWFSYEQNCHFFDFWRIVNYYRTRHVLKFVLNIRWW